MNQCNCALISGIDNVKRTLTTIRVHKSLRAIKVSEDLKKRIYLPKSIDVEIYFFGKKLMKCCLTIKIEYTDLINQRDFSSRLYYEMDVLQFKKNCFLG